MSMPVTVTDAQILSAQGGDEMAMWDVISAFEPMMRTIIRSAAPAADADKAEDLLQEARIALLQHIREYSTEGTAAALSSFAYRGIHRAVAEEWIRMSSPFKVDPTSVIRVRRALWEASGDVEEAWLIVSADAQAKRQMSREVFVSIREALMDVSSLEAPLASSETGVTLGDTIPDETSGFTDSTERRDLARWLLTQIPQRQAYALRAFYGINALKQTDEQTSDELGLSAAKNCAALRTTRRNGVRSARNVAAGNHITLAA
jgi:RNA polymerase primary sigma factor